MPSQFKYKAFISYSHADQKWARWLHRSLETYRTPKRLIGKATKSGPVPPRLTPIFRDRDDLASSADLPERINQVLGESENLILICSPSSAKSQWANQEVEVYKKLGRSENIFCLIVDGDPAAVGTEQDCFPPAIRDYYDEQGLKQQGSAEPMAADLRKEADGKFLAKLKILAGLLQLDLDQLRQREMHRRQRRLMGITAGSVAAALVTVVLAINATMARNEADQRRAQAEDLLGFMVGDLRSSLEPIGRLDLLESVGQQAMSYFESVSVSDLSDEELLRQSQVLTQLGEIRFNQLQYDDALAAFAEAFERSAELQLNDPADGDRLFNRSQAEFWVGYSHWLNGDRDDAREWLSRYRDSALILYSLDPARDDWLAEVAFGYHNLSVLNEEAGELALAEEGFKLEIEILDELIARSPTRANQEAEADAYSWLGNIQFSLGDLEASLENYAIASSTIRQLHEQNPIDAFLKQELGTTIQVLAEITSVMGELDKSEIYCEEAIALFDELVAVDSTNRNIVRMSTRPRITLGSIYAGRGDWTNSSLRASESIVILERLVDEGFGSHNINSQLAASYELKAIIEKSTGQLSQALDSIEVALTHFRQIIDEDRLNDERSGRLASLLVLQGEVFSELGNPELAIKSWQESTDLIEGKILVSESSYFLDPWARILMLTGRVTEGREISDALAARRYFPLIGWPD